MGSGKREKKTWVHTGESRGFIQLCFLSLSSPVSRVNSGKGCGSRVGGEEGSWAHWIKGEEDHRAHRIREEGVKGSQDTSWVRLGGEER
jgi:hypothetical protein